MCLLAFAWQVHETHRLVLVGNRDEMHARPTAPLGWWTSPPILGGRDLAAGGTWLALDRTGRFGALTNFREPSPPHPPELPDRPSRGELIPRFLTGTQSPLVYLRELALHAQNYAGFSIVVGNQTELAYYCNRDLREPLLLPPGIHGLSNATLNVPWPKVTLAQERLRHAIRQPLGDPERLADLLTDRASAPDALLPDTGVGLPLERRLSPAFIVGDAYGTRSTSVLLFGAGDSPHRLIERSYTPDGTIDHTLVFET